MTEPKGSLIVKALIAAQEKFPAVKKTRTARAGSYSYQYADLSDLLHAVGPVLRANGIAVSQRYSVQEGITILETSLLHSSGEIISSVLPVSGPGPTAQELGSLMTYMRRYALSALLGIAAEDDDDGAAGNEATPTKSEAGKMYGAEGPPKVPKVRSLATEAQRRMIWARAKSRGDALGWHDNTVEEALRKILADLGFSSSKELSSHMVDGVLAAIQKWSDEPEGPPLEEL